MAVYTPKSSASIIRPILRIVPLLRIYMRRSANVVADGEPTLTCYCLNLRTSEPYPAPRPTTLDPRL